MSIDFKKLVKPYKKESINQLKDWIKINSVDDPTTYSNDAPFGKGVK